jgi:hypothetical protein
MSAMASAPCSGMIAVTEAEAAAIRAVFKRQRLRLWFIHLLRRTIALAVSANCYALNLTVRLIVAHFHCKRFTTCSRLPHPEPNGLIHVTTSFIGGSSHAASPTSQR